MSGVRRNARRRAPADCVAANRVRTDSRDFGSFRLPRARIPALRRKKFSTSLMPAGLDIARLGNARANASTMHAGCGDDANTRTLKTPVLSKQLRCAHACASRRRMVRPAFAFFVRVQAPMRDGVRANGTSGYTFR
jgi:hypothetical protein